MNKCIGLLLAIHMIRSLRITYDQDDHAQGSATR